METVRMFEKYEYAEITIEELADIHPSLYRFCDVRDEVSYRYGSIPKAENISNIVELAEEGKLDKNISYVLYCMKGIQSMDMAYELRGMGYDAVSLKGGYAAWLTSSYREDYEDKQKEVETSIRKTFHKCIFSPFAKAINEYELLKPGDKVAVCISGGKDSMLMAKLFQEIKRHNKFDFELVFLVMDPGYSEVNRLVIEKNARMLGVPITIFETQIFDAVYDVKQSPCYLCARMRRGYLYSKAKELGCNKIALGHHYDDVIETILMGMLYGAQVQTMMPKLHSTNFEGMELIRPMYYIREDDIMHWRDFNNLHFIQCACHFTDTCSSCREDGTTASKRMEIKQLIKDMKKVNPYVEGNIFKSVYNVSLGTVIEYKDKDGVKHNFLENYDEK
ncbi:PP-loop family protein [Eshraghiella crossota DSM 2876]|uniref:PP-loop family protein n=2 Tax=Eshraghiella TaxID=3342669 RepID=D4RZP6_9FIRM|nr:PP-loop family protein [Butyrivibrio crossotus DSM 2876]